MNRADLVSAVAIALDLSPSRPRPQSAVLAPISGALARGEEVKLNGFDPFEIAASRSVKFKPAKALRDTLSPAAPETPRHDRLPSVRGSILELVATMVGAYVAHNRLPVAELPALAIPSTSLSRPPHPRKRPSRRRRR